MKMRILSTNPEPDIDATSMFESNKQNVGSIERCTFCGSNKDEVFTLIAGPNVFICDECVEKCVEIIANERKNANADGPSE
jgi:ATP-dependent Clp protease ATP-binding subunit ClpX